MKATLEFYNYYRSAQISITKRFVEKVLGLSYTMIGHDMIVHLAGYNKEDFEKNLKPFMHHGKGGITKITF